MKFQLISDLHLEYYKKLPNLEKLLMPSAEILILAGNICYAKHKNFLLFFETISRMYKYVFFILGNNEYYYNIENDLFSIAEIDLYIKNQLAHLENVFIFQEKVLIVGDILIAGTTLWSYISKKSYTNRQVCMLPNNFIRCNNKLWINPEHTNKIHLKQKQWLTNIINGYPNKKKIIITHHMPSFLCLDPKNKYDLNSKYNFSNCDSLMEKCDIWCCGKRTISKKINGCTIHMNACGYLWENNNSYRKNYTFFI